MSMKFQVEWEEEVLDMKTCVKRCCNVLPRLVIVRSGEETEEEGYCFYDNDIFCLTHIVKLERIIATDIGGGRVSLPVNYPVNFHFVLDDDEYGPAETLSFLIKRLETGERFVAEDSNKVTLGVLEYQSSYYERFFIGNNILDGEPYEGVVVIPFHTDIKLSLSKGLSGGTKEDFEEYMKIMHLKTQKFMNERNVEVYAEIELFNEGCVDTRDYINYDYIKPGTYFRLNQAKRLLVCPELIMTESPLYFALTDEPPPIPSRVQSLDRHGKLPAAPPETRSRKYFSMHRHDKSGDDASDDTDSSCGIYDDLHEADILPEVPPRKESQTKKEEKKQYNMPFKPFRSIGKAIGKKLQHTVRPLPRKLAQKMESLHKHNQTQANKRNSLQEIPVLTDGDYEVYNIRPPSSQNTCNNKEVVRSISDSGVLLGSEAKNTSPYKVPPTPVPILVFKEVSEKHIHPTIKAGSQSEHIHPTIKAGSQSEYIHPTIKAGSQSEEEDNDVLEICDDLSTIDSMPRQQIFKIPPKSDSVCQNVNDGNQTELTDHDQGNKLQRQTEMLQIADTVRIPVPTPRQQGLPVDHPKFASQHSQNIKKCKEIPDSKQQDKNDQVPASEKQDQFEEVPESEYNENQNTIYEFEEVSEPEPSTDHDMPMGLHRAALPLQPTSDNFDRTHTKQIEEVQGHCEHFKPTEQTVQQNEERSQDNTEQPDNTEQSDNTKQSDNTDQSDNSESDDVYLTISDVPADLSHITIKQVSNCLNLLRLSKYVNRFRQKQVDGQMFEIMTLDMLTTEFGLTKFESMKVMRFFTKGWRPKLI